jgi:plasmid stabilization system protein ParE
MKQIWSPRAELDVVHIGGYIAEDDPVAAIAWVEKIKARVDGVARMPRSGRVVPELAEIGRSDVREVFVGSYRILYTEIAGGIAVLTVFEGSRQMPPLDSET